VKLRSTHSSRSSHSSRSTILVSCSYINIKIEVKNFPFIFNSS